MTDLTDGSRAGGRRVGAGLFALAVFVSAALVFSVQPMVTKMILPRLGGSTAVWNTSLAFFQTALLVGYAYAHALQRLKSVRVQMVVHLAVLIAAALVLPLRLSGLMGEPSVDMPALWLIGMLTLSLGAPFAALSATAPLVQAWYARTHPGERDPYVLYAASNVGSLLALLAYPIAIEPLLRLGTQSLSWSLGYAAFAALIAGLAVMTWRARTTAVEAMPAAAAAVSWRDRLIWLLLAAAPSSLLLGVTGHLTSDVASAPFLWVIPLALYLVTFIIAFQSRPAIPPGTALVAQVAFPGLALVLFNAPAAPLLVQFAVHLFGFFFTCLVCAHALAARRPHPARLTEFYLWMSIGGVIGGAFNAFVAPVIFNGVWEYPIVLVLACLARPWGKGPLTRFQTVTLIGGLMIAAGLVLPIDMPRFVRNGLLFIIVAYSVAHMYRALSFVALLAGLGLASYLPMALRSAGDAHRSFFGVVQIFEAPTPVLGAVKAMVHGSTLHGTQGMRPAQRCWPTTYYATSTPIGQALRLEQARRPAVSIGAVGLGAGTVAAYVRPTDRMRFFEIDPLVAKIAFDPTKFSFIKGCAQGPVDLTLGDARQSLERIPAGSYDILLVDAFSSDSVPTHLMTVEAMRSYLRVLKPGGVAVLHLSNRHLELSGPAAAAMREAGGAMVEQSYYSKAQQSYVETSSLAIVAARAQDGQVLDAYRKSPGWTPTTHVARAWTDDYTNVAGALWARFTGKRDY